MALFLAFVAVALAALALVRIRELGERVRALHEDLFEERRVRGWPPEPVVPQPAAKPEPVIPEVRTPRPAPAPEPTTAPLSPPPPPPPRIQPPPPSPQAGRRVGPRTETKTEPKIDWERWLGVRGAAVLGGIFLAVAGVLFFQYSIEHGLLTKEMRVALGALAGVACLVVGELVRRRGYALTANAITGAGAVILYAAFWSAHLLGIFPFGVSFAAMVATTALCCFLSWRNESQLVAWLGLSGGFATPILLSTGRDEPIALFSYLILLDVSFLFVARRRRWPLVGALGLLGTLLIQGAWAMTRMGPGTFAIGVVALGAFGMLFALLAPSVPPGSTASHSDRARWIAVRVAALLLPFAMAAQFASRIDVGYHLYPLVLLASLLAAAASVLARRQEAPYVPVGAAAGSGAIALVWVLSNRLETARVVELVLCAVFACAVLHVFCEWGRSRNPAAAKEHDLASAVGAGSMIAVLFAAAYPSRGADVWPLVAGFTLLPLFLLRLDALAPRTTRPFLACIPAGLGIAVWMQASFGAGQHPVFWSTIAVVFVAPILFLACARIRKHEGGRKSTFAAAAIACLPLFSVLELRFGHETHPAVALLPVLALGLCMLLGASGARSGLLVGLAAITTCLFQWSVETNIRPIDPDSARICVAILLASSAVFLAAPLARRSIWERSGTIAWTAPLAMLFGFPGAVEMWRATLPGSVHAGTAHAIPPLAFGILLLVAAAWAFRDRRDEFSADRASTRSSIARLGLHVAALAWPFFAVALAKALDRPQWAPAAAALGLGCALLWKRTDHPPLAYAVVGSAGLATLILLGRALGESLPSFPLPLASGLGFDFLLPAAALVAAGLVGRAAEVARARPEGKVMYGSDAPLLFAISGVAGLASLLVWITVEVENRFAEGATFRVRFGDLPARDLSLSIAWAVFALLLLFVGAGRKLGALRWVSLVLLLATIGKVFLLDLEDLEGLYRVGSFLGLAVSLLVVSLLYQRFVFRKTGAERA